MLDEQEKYEQILILRKHYQKETALSIYKQIEKKVNRTGNYGLQVSRSLTYIAAEHPSYFEEVIKYDDPRDVILEGENLSGNYGHWFSVSLNNLNIYIDEAKKFYFEKDKEDDIKDKSYWDALAIEENNREYDDFKSSEILPKNKKHKVRLDQPKNILLTIDNNEICEKIWKIRPDYLFDFFKSLSNNKPQLNGYSDLENAIIKDLLNRLSEKLYNGKNWDILTFKDSLPIDIKSIVENGYNNNKDLLEKIYDVTIDEKIEVQPFRLIRALLIEMKGDLTIWDELTQMLSPDEIILYAEYDKNGIRFRNLNYPLNSKFIDDKVMDKIKILALETFKNDLPM